MRSKIGNPKVVLVAGVLLFIGSFSSVRTVYSYDCTGSTPYCMDESSGVLGPGVYQYGWYEKAPGVIVQGCHYLDYQRTYGCSGNDNDCSGVSPL